MLFGCAAGVWFKGLQDGDVASEVLLLSIVFDELF